MLNKLHTQNKNPQKLSSVFSKTPDRGMFEPRSFVIQQKQQDDSQQPNLKTSLMRVELYGHHFHHTHPKK
ncbi:hypothetical protein [Nostoc sp.]|uniref:hypothetical protein n=1 Tax=Nostoc sp. TaxID=1180 RepID=UPI002FF63396